MISLETLKCRLRENLFQSKGKVGFITEDEYRSRYEILTQCPGSIRDREFIIPQLTQVLTPLTKSRTSLSVLEIGPGSSSMLGGLATRLRQHIGSYTAFEPNKLFAKSIERWLSPAEEDDTPFPSLQTHSVLPIRLTMPWCEEQPSIKEILGDKKFDVILFSHGVYGMKPRVEVIQGALSLLDARYHDSTIVVFHRGEHLHLKDLVCRHAASYPTGSFSVYDSDDSLDSFTTVLMRIVPEENCQMKNTLKDWRKVCRDSGRRNGSDPPCLAFRSPEVMATFTQDATALSELAKSLLTKGPRIMKDQAHYHTPAAVLTPKDAGQLQDIMKWAIKHKSGLSVIGGIRNDHCNLPNVVAVDMKNFQEILIDDDFLYRTEVMTIGGGCTAEAVIKKGRQKGVGITTSGPPGAGAGSWLQSGIGHFTRSMGIPSNLIVGAVIVSPKSGDILWVGNVPKEHRPKAAIRSKDDDDDRELMCAIRGAGPNFGIFTSVTFKLQPKMSFLNQYSSFACADSWDAGIKLRRYLGDLYGLQRDHSANVFLFCDNGRLHIGGALLEASKSKSEFDVIETPSWMSKTTLSNVAPFTYPLSAMDMVEEEAFMGGLPIATKHKKTKDEKTTSFTRCLLFYENLQSETVTGMLMLALKKRTTDKCYLHIVQGSGTVSKDEEVSEYEEVSSDEEYALHSIRRRYACVVNGVWFSDDKDIEIAHATIQWVYDTVATLLPWCDGVCSADLGPDPRDQALSTKAFGSDWPRLSRLKSKWDPENVLRYSCQLSKPITTQKLVVLVTGHIAAGKDHCAKAWASALEDCTHRLLNTKVLGIDDDIKKEYAQENNVDYKLLLHDQVYKEQHRAGFNAFREDRLYDRPELAKEHFLDLVYEDDDVDVLLITGMRDHAPVATFSPLAPDCRFIEVRVEAYETIRRNRRRDRAGNGFQEADLEHVPDVYFRNDTHGDRRAKDFAKSHLAFLFSEELGALKKMTQGVGSHLTPGIPLNHVLNIVQFPEGLGSCTTLLTGLFPANRRKIECVVAIQNSGGIFASSVASKMELPFIEICEGGKLQYPKFSVQKHVSTLPPRASEDGKLEISETAIPSGASVYIVHDTLASGNTISTMIELLEKAGTPANRIIVFVVAEYPAHGGRQLLQRRGFGKVVVRSLLVLNDKFEAKQKI